MSLSETALQHLIAYLEQEEGYQEFAYDDETGQRVEAPVGKLTLGYGWNIQDNGCPQEIAIFAMRFYASKADEELTKRLSYYDALDDIRKVVICDMAYNMGERDVESFHGMLTAIQKQDFTTASIAMLNSIWAKKVGNRAITLSKMMQTGQWVHTPNQ